ncbi:ADP-ribosylation [Periconia macrospinosa]|uniref:ADP-ribosylation n=1 Tax=Periconia macrospinosa TaxID=97972 RepID=A0A2V1E1M3_9PLEO|nr:ADP-ribosylation [Periconia macrospinosa]
MLGPSRFIYVASFILLGPALAANLFRMTFIPPVQIKAAGGFVANNPDGTGSVTEHARNTLGNEDPWISTTSSKKFAQSGATSPSDAYVYEIIPRGPGNGEIKDVQKEFDKIGEENPHPEEKEFSIKGHIPWGNIVGWEKWTRSKYAKTVNRQDYDADPAGNSKREIPFIA